MENNELRVLIVDDVPETRTNVKKLIQFEENIKIVGEAVDGKESVEMAKNLQPDCILMDINMPGIDGIRATELINQELPHAVIIIMSVQGEQEYLRKAMLAGARDFLTKPFSGDELVNTINQVWEMEIKRRIQLESFSQNKEPGRVVTVFSAKGGVGKTTLATNLAVALSKENKVILIDVDLQFGDVPIMLNIQPTRTISDWVGEQEASIESFLIEHDSGLYVLPAPNSPEESELITAENVSLAIDELRKLVDYVIIDTAPNFSEVVIQGLEQADDLLLLATSDIPNLKNLRRCLDLLEKLQLGEKVKIVLNRITKESGLSFSQFNEHLDHDVWQQIPDESQLAMESANKGIPFISLFPKSKVSQSVTQIMNSLTGKEQPNKGRRRYLGIF